MSSRTVEIIIDVRDQTGGKLDGLKQSLNQMTAAAQKISNKLKSLAYQNYAAQIRLIDRVTAPASKINSLLKKIAGGVYKATIKISDGALAGIKKIESALLRISSKAYNVAVNVKNGALSKMGGVAEGALMGAGMFAPMAGMMGVGFGVGNAIQASMGFEKQMSKVQAVRQLSKDSEEMKALTQQAKDLGAQTAWTRQQVGEAQYYQALAGWDTQQIIKSTPHILNLASAGDVDLGRASDIVTDSMTAFQLKATETYTDKFGRQVNAVEHYADMMAKLQAISNTDINQMGEAFKYGAPTIGAMYADKDIQTRMQAAEDAMIMTGLMANAGIKGSAAGTGINNIFNRMGSMNRNAYQALRAMGVEYQDQNGDMLSVGTIMRSLGKRFKEGVDPSQLVDFAEQISGEKINADTRRKLDSFIEQTQKNGGKMSGADMLKMSSMLAGAEHMGKLLAVMLGDWDEMAEKMDNAHGTAKEMAETQLDNLAGSFTKLGSAWDAFQQDLFTGTAGDGLRGFVDTVTDVLSNVNKLFADGINIGDFATMIGDVIGRLKNKFLEFDGIGSVLAGGALAAGLMKIITLSQRAMNSLRGITTLKGGAGGSSGGVPAGQKVGTMTVSAGVVNVNGKVSGGVNGGRKVGNQAIIDNYNRTRDRIRGGANPTPTPIPSRFAGMKSAAGGAAAFAGIFSLLDIMSVKSQNAARLASATDENRAQIIKENRQAEWEAAGGGLGAVAGGAIGAALGSLAGPMGTMIGGMVGSMIGEKLGMTLGEKGAEREVIKSGTNDAVLSKEISKSFEKPETPTDFSFGKTETQPKKNLEEFATFSSESLAWKGQIKKTTAALTTATQDATEDLESLTQRLESETARDNAAFKRQSAEARNFGQTQQNDSGFDYYQQQAQTMAIAPEVPSFDIGEKFSGLGENVGEFFSGLGETISEGLSSISESAGEIFSGLGETISEGLSSISEGAGEIFSGLGDMISSGLEGASAAAEGAMSTISATFTTAKEMIQSAWAELPSFFSGVFSGLGGAAEGAGSAIYSGLTSVIGSIIGAWQSAAATISSIISSIASAAASAGASAGSFVAGAFSAHAEGGFITHPEFALIGEAGPELILPLNDRERSMQLLNQASDVLGLNSEGGFTAGNSENTSENISNGISINLGGVNFNISSDNPQDIMQAIKENLNDVTDTIAAQLSGMIDGVHKNQPLTV